MSSQEDFGVYIGENALSDNQFQSYGAVLVPGWGECVEDAF